MVGHADLGLGRLGQDRVSGEGEAGTDVVLEVSVKLGLCGGVMHCKERRQSELRSVQYIKAMLVIRFFYLSVSIL